MPVVVDGVNGITYPTWTTASRPTNPNVGQTGFNTTLGVLEIYDGTQWNLINMYSQIGTNYAYKYINF